MERGGISYTIDTLLHFRAEHPVPEFFLLLGADMLHDLPHWHNAAQVCELAIPVAVRRAGVAEPDFACLSSIASLEQIERFRRHQVEMPEIGLSSTEIRKRVAGGRSVRYRTPRAVEKYIQRGPSILGKTSSDFLRSRQKTRLPIRLPLPQAKACQYDAAFVEATFEAKGVLLPMQSSSPATPLRILVMLACLVAIPLAAVFGTALPDVARQWWDSGWGKTKAIAKFYSPKHPHSGPDSRRMKCRDRRIGIRSLHRMALRDLR